MLSGSAKVCSRYDEPPLLAHDTANVPCNSLTVRPEPRRVNAICWMFWPLPTYSPFDASAGAPDEEVEDDEPPPPDATAATTTTTTTTTTASGAAAAGSSQP